MKLLAKFNLILLQQAQLMMASAKSVREYTATDLSPLLQQNPGHRVHFLPETIPFYGATTTFNNLRKDNPDYTNYVYKEAALNPTNLEDRASDWEADIVYELRNHGNRRSRTSAKPPPANHFISPIPSKRRRSVLGAIALPPPLLAR
jgi:hypothetical protein